MIPQHLPRRRQRRRHAGHHTRPNETRKDRLHAEDDEAAVGAVGIDRVDGGEQQLLLQLLAALHVLEGLLRLDARVLGDDAGA